MTSKEIYQNIDARLTHLEDAVLDYREILLKLVKQGNTIVQFLKQFDIEDITDEYMMDIEKAESFVKKEMESGKYKHISELIDEYKQKYKEIQKFEDELKKHKEDLTPGQMGES